VIIETVVLQGGKSSTSHARMGTRKKFENIVVVDAYLLTEVVGRSVAKKRLCLRWPPAVWSSYANSSII